MSFQLDVWREAQEDIADAAAWYDDRSDGLGSQFIDVVGRCLVHVRDQPARFPVVHDQIRRALLARFPYGVFFFVDGATVRVVACMHAHRDPANWQSRVPW